MPELQILEYLEKKGPANTFKLARALDIDRTHLLGIIQKLEAKGALTVKNGMVQFLKFLSEETAITEPEKKAPSATPKLRKVKPKVVETLQSENKLLKEKLTELKETILELEQKAGALPKTITRTVTKTIIKKIPVIKRIRSPSKIITKVVTKKVPATLKDPISSFLFPNKVWTKLRVRSKKLKIPMSRLLKNIQQFKKESFKKKR